MKRILYSLLLFASIHPSYQGLTTEQLQDATKNYVEYMVKRGRRDQNALRQEQINQIYAATIEHCTLYTHPLMDISNEISDNTSLVEREDLNAVDKLYNYEFDFKHYPSMTAINKKDAAVAIFFICMVKRTFRIIPYREPLHFTEILHFNEEGRLDQIITFDHFSNPWLHTDSKTPTQKINDFIAFRTNPIFTQYMGLSPEHRRTKFAPSQKDRDDITQVLNRGKIHYGPLFE